MYAIGACVCPTLLSFSHVVCLCSAAEEEASGETIATPEVRAAARHVHDASPGDAQTCRRVPRHLHREQPS